MKYLAAFLISCLIYLYFTKSPNEAAPRNISEISSQSVNLNSNSDTTDNNNSIAGKSRILNLSDDYPTDTALIFIKENPVTEETCNLHKRTSTFKNNMCINNNSDWKILCEKANGATDEALQVPAKQRSALGESKNSRDALIAVAQNGGAIFISTKWINSENFGECQMTVQYSGLYQGTSINETLTSGAMMAIGISSKDQKPIIAQ